MHGLRTIVKLNQVEQDFVDHILSTPIPEVNLLKVWQDWKQETQANEPVQVHTN